jgi:hypothetical protein
MPFDNPYHSPLGDIEILMDAAVESLASSDFPLISNAVGAA